MSNVVQYCTILSNIVWYCSILFKGLFQLSLFWVVIMFSGILRYCPIIMYILLRISWYCQALHDIVWYWPILSSGTCYKCLGKVIYHRTLTARLHLTATIGFWWNSIHYIIKVALCTSQNWQYQDIPNNIGQYHKIFKNIITTQKRESWKRHLNNIRQYWTILDNIRQYFTILYNIAQHWTKSEKIWQYLATL